MPYRSKKPCRHFGCGGLTLKAYCVIHHAVYQEKARQRIKKKNERFDKGRDSASARGYSARWAKVARNYLHFHPLCVACEKVGIVQQAEQVDHILPHRGDYDLFWDADNLQGLCRRCHAKKTRKESHTAKTY